MDQKFNSKVISDKERFERTKIRQNLTARNRRIRIKSDDDLCMKTISTIVEVLVSTYESTNKDNASKAASIAIMTSFKVECEK